jgi:Flp pilus assembly protein TadD
MFVAMARGVGLNARFQEVEIPPEWSFNQETYVLNRHINIHFDLRIVGPRIIDFNIESFDADYHMRVVSDSRALAHFFNNLGAELMQQGEKETAFAAFRKALAEYDPTFSPAWDNLGTLYSRHGVDTHAEAAYLKALEIDSAALVAMSNLTTLYDRRGDPEQAGRYRNKVDSHRRKNPYYRYNLAQKAFDSEDYDDAIEHLKYAIRKLKDEARFCFLLGRVYLKMGDQEKARKWISKARNLATDEELKKAYSAEIDRLESASR